MAKLMCERLLLRGQRRRLLTVRNFRNLFVGFLFGLFMGTFISRDEQMAWNEYARDSLGILYTMPTNSPKVDNFIYVGVMTTANYLSTRAVAINLTWADTIPGTVEYYPGIEAKTIETDLPLVMLPGVDDSYPPMKKAFMLLKYIHDNFIDKYEWFMRADDDVYIKGIKLEKFLRSINSSQVHYIGQSGQGSPDNPANMYSWENFCIGGPGVIFSRETLKKLVSNIGYVIKNLYTIHDDVEIGRAVKMLANIDCTWSYEMHQLFFHNHSSPDDSFKGDLQNAQVHRAITLHPIKTIQNLYRMDSHVRHQDIQELNLKAAKLKREILLMDELMNKHRDKEMVSLGDIKHGTPYITRNYSEVLPWEFIAPYGYSTWANEQPRHALTRAYLSELGNATSQYIDLISENAAFNVMGLHKFLNGYRSVNPKFGTSYQLHLQLKKMRSASGKIMGSTTQHHIYLYRPFGKVEFTEETINQHHLNVNDNDDERVSTEQFSHVTVHVVVPLAGRFDTFKRFMINFEKVFLQNRNIKLAVVLYEDSSEEMPFSDIIKAFREQYVEADIRLIHGEGEFTRGRALTLGAAQFPDDALLFFVDVDLLISHETITRCRRNNIRGKQVYYPGMFSMYNPSIVHKNTAGATPKRNISKELGFYIDFSFGMVCAYNSDFKSVGGFDLNITGWGAEDVDLFDKFVVSDLNIFRAFDIDLIHPYHAKVCDTKLKPDQYEMCLGSKSTIFANTAQLSNLVQWRRMYV
ncbi:chondroitin sulfate synthase 1-like [Glandiceps talaboti]